MYSVYVQCIPMHTDTHTCTCTCIHIQYIITLVRTGSEGVAIGTAGSAVEPEVWWEGQRRGKVEEKEGGERGSKTELRGREGQRK